MQSLPNLGTRGKPRLPLQMPLLCFQSALVNSMRGAAFLSGLKDGLVADVGGTTTDLGVLVKGVPRPAAATALLAGQVRTNFPLPDCISIGAACMPRCLWCLARPLCRRVRQAGLVGRCACPQQLMHLQVWGAEASSPVTVLGRSVSGR